MGAIKLICAIAGARVIKLWSWIIVSFLKGSQPARWRCLKHHGRLRALVTSQVGAGTLSQAMLPSSSRQGAAAASQE